MKIKFKLPAIVLGLLLLFTGTTVKAQDDNVSLQQFYDELSPYGTWIQDPDYGYVWRPDVDQAEFRPYYTNGRWVMTEYGNTWVSNYDWGWAPFHYGRWIYDRYSRWIWIPDTTWGPAWVDWRSGNGYYGWAPMGPLVSIHINIGRRYYRPDYCWNFIPQRNIYYSSFPRYRSYNNYVFINRTTVINNTYVYKNRTYYTGPRPEEVRRATNQDVRVYSVAHNTRQDAPRIDGNKVNIYTPRPNRDVQNNPAPRNVGTYSGNGRAADRNIANNRTEERGPVQDRRTGISPEQKPERSTAPVTRGSQEMSPRREQPAAQRDSQRPPVMQQRENNRQERPQSMERTQQREPQNIPPRRERQQSAPQQAPQRQEPQVQPRQQRQQQAPPQRSGVERSSTSGGGRESSGGGGRPGRG